MSDYCRACSEDLFGRDYGEMAGLTSPADWAAGRAAIVLCEGCGPIQVDPDGRCVSADCTRAGRSGHGPQFDSAGRPP